MSAAVAREDLQQADLTVSQEERRHDPSTPSGQVIAQSPLAGEEVAPGTAVELTVSLGPEKPSSPQDVVEAYHRRVTREDYGGAWELFTPSHQRSTDWQGWIDGFQDTVRSSVSEFETLQQGSSFAKLRCRVNFEDNINGQTKRGTVVHTYALRRIGGNWKIDARGAVTGSYHEY
jgi:hypothetical protein